MDGLVLANIYTGKIQSMKNMLPNFSIEFNGEPVMVSRIPSAAGNFYSVQYGNDVVRIKGEGFNSILWIEKGKGATLLAAELGRLIEKYLHLSTRRDYAFA